MSRLTGADAYGLMEAYQAVYAPQELTEEQVLEEVETWVNSLLEEGYDLSDYTWEEMYEGYLSEMGGPNNRPAPAKPETINLKPQKGVTAGGNVTLGRGYEATLGGKKGQLSYVRGSQGRLQRTFRQLGSEANPPSAAQAKQDQADPRRNSASTPRPAVTPAATSPRPAATRPATGIARGSGPSTPAKPATPTSPAKPATPTVPTAPATPASPTKPATTPMQQFAAANPKLAAASAERDRTRGTSATTNPLMKDMKSRLPAPKTPSPSTAKTGFDLAKKGVNLAASFDMFDVVKGYLIGEGYADTEEAALAIMTNMSEEWKQSIIEERAPGVKPYTPNRLNPLPKEKPLSGKKGDGSGYGADEKFKKPDDKIEKPGTEVPAPKKGGYGRIFSNIPYGIGAHANRNRSRNSTIRGMDPGAPRSEKLAPTEKKKPSKEIVRKRKDTNESYNIILSYLLDEGYANSVEAAESIMVSMSEDWILSIIG